MIRRGWMVAVLCCVIWLGIPRQSEAGFSTSLTLGGNYSLLLNTSVQTERIGFNIEGTVGWRIPFLSVDLGIFYDFLKRDFQLRPGIKVHLGWFYFRVAVPVAMNFKFQTDTIFNVGTLFGAGFEIRINQFAFLIEANITPFYMRIDINDQGGGLWLPAELRLGVSYHF